MEIFYSNLRCKVTFEELKPCKVEAVIVPSYSYIYSYMLRLNYSDSCLYVQQVFNTVFIYSKFVSLSTVLSSSRPNQCSQAVAKHFHAILVLKGLYKI